MFLPRFRLRILAISSCDDRSRSDTNVISMNFYIYANLAMFFIFPVLFCSNIFLFEHETIHTIRVLNVFDSFFRP